MTSRDELMRLKRRISHLLLGVPGVSGVGTPKGELTIYLEEESATVRRNVVNVLEREAPGVPVTFVVAGVFRAQ